VLGISGNKAVFPISWRPIDLVLLRGAGRSPMLLLVKLSRWRLDDGGGSGEVFFNKRTSCPPVLGDLAPLRSSFSKLHGEDRRGSEEEEDAAFWSASSAASHWLRAVLSSTPMAEGRLLRALSLACRRQLFLNLQADVPIWRPSCSFNAVVPVCSVPSGVVPGDGADDRDSKPRSKLGGEGHGVVLDCVLTLCSRVLFAYSEGLFVISSFLLALVVILKPTNN